MLLVCFFFNDTATTEIYTLSLHDALPISKVTEEPEVSLVLLEPLELMEKMELVELEDLPEPKE